MTNKYSEADRPDDVLNPEGASTILLGFDWGTNKSCIHASYAGTTEVLISAVIPTVVGYASEGIVDNLLPGNAKVLFGQEALKHRLHLRLVAPMVNGSLKDLPAARDFARHIRDLINPPAGTDIRAVIGIPANANVAMIDAIKQTVSGLFDRVLLIPEPFLAALGFRDEARLGSPDYVDPVHNSLFVDIGAGTTDICLVQGYYPTSKELVSIPFAGDTVDALLGDAIKQSYPDTELSVLKVREIKEQYSFVGSMDSPIMVGVVVGGKRRTLDLGTQIGTACTELLNNVFETSQILITRASSDSVSELLQNIIITGGGSKIRHLDSELQRMLTEAGYDNPRVRVAGDNYKEFVAKGALKAARQARENQWQNL